MVSSNVNSLLCMQSFNCIKIVTNNHVLMCSQFLSLAYTTTVIAYHYCVASTQTPALPWISFIATSQHLLIAASHLFDQYLHVTPKLILIHTSLRIAQHRPMEAVHQHLRTKSRLGPTQYSHQFSGYLSFMAHWICSFPVSAHTDINETHN